MPSSVLQSNIQTNINIFCVEKILHEIIAENIQNCREDAINIREDVYSVGTTVPLTK